jgi:hypothetical protein
MPLFSMRNVSRGFIIEPSQGLIFVAEDVVLHKQQVLPVIPRLLERQYEHYTKFSIN